MPELSCALGSSNEAVHFVGSFGRIRRGHPTAELADPMRAPDEPGDTLLA